MIKKTFKILFILLLALVMFVGVRIFSGDQAFIASLDQWLDTYQEQDQIDDEDGEEDENHDDDDVPSRVEIYQGLPAVKLTAEIIDRSGIELGTLQVVKQLHEARATGQVVDFEPLLRKRTAYQDAETNKAVSKERMNAAVKVHKRLRTLYEERLNVSLKQVDAAQLEVVENRAQVRIASKQMANIRLETVHLWGAELADWALGNIKNKEKSGYFDRLLQNEDVLLIGSLPPGLSLPKETSFIYVNSHPDRSTARKAYLISPAVYTNTLSQGVTYYFRVRAEKMRIGMRLSAWIVLSDDVETGVDVPLASVIWYGGQPWVYVQVADDLYQRRPVSSYRETDFGWFITDTFKQDDRVVTRGGQLLLSEELRWQIPEEDDD